MSCYGPLASWYDQLTGDVPYEQFAIFYEAEFARAGGEFRLLLDLCCGTGTLTWLMAGRGYELIAVDASVDMLMQAREKPVELKTPPLFLLQDAAELDLYGTVDAAYCSLDGMNYFSRAGALWERSSEEHIEYAHSPEIIAKLLSDSGFADVQLRRDGPQGDSGRLFICAVRK